jgi:hypothetical protein
LCIGGAEGRDGLKSCAKTIGEESWTNVVVVH